MSSLGHWASSEWCPVVSRPFCSSPVTSSSVQTTLRSQRQFRTLDSLENRMQNSAGTLELTQPLGPYSTHGKQEIPPTNGWLGGATHPIQLHTSMQSVPWPPSYSLTTTTSILDPPWAMPTWAPTGLASQHMPKTKCSGTVQTCLPDVQTLPVMSSDIQCHPVMSSDVQLHPDHSETFQIHQEQCRTLECLENLEKSGHSGKPSRTPST